MNTSKVSDNNDWHEENCECSDCQIYKIHETRVPPCGCAMCYYKERYTWYKTGYQDVKQQLEQKTNDYEKLNELKDELVKGNWKKLGEIDVNSSNKTVYEHDMIMAQQREYFEQRIARMESDHKIEFESKIGWNSDSAKNICKQEVHDAIKQKFGMSVKEMVEVIQEQQTEIDTLEAQDENKPDIRIVHTVATASVNRKLAEANKSLAEQRRHLANNQYLLAAEKEKSHNFETQLAEKHKECEQFKKKILYLQRGLNKNIRQIQQLESINLKFKSEEDTYSIERPAKRLVTTNPSSLENSPEAKKENVTDCIDLT